MGYGRREVRMRNEKQGRKLNLVKVFIVIAIILAVIVSIVFLIKDGKKSEDSFNKKNQEILDEAKQELDNEEQKEFKTIEKMLEEFGGEISQKVNSDTYYINKDGVTYTAYVNDEIVEGKIVPWSGESKQPPIDEAGNINVYSAEELKWIADQVINGDKNFSGVTITLRQDIDLGGRKNDEGKWEGKEWTPIIGFLDELPKKEQDKNNENNEETPVEDENVDIINENLKRFAGVFDGNGHSIRGLYINISKRYQGLFGVSSGIIQNLTIKNSSVNGGVGTGAIVGLNGGKVVNCHITNTEVGGASKVGGISGIGMGNSWLENCFVSDSVVISGGDYTGGVVGYVNNNSAIVRCENEAMISGNNFVGGNVGIAFYGTIIQGTINRSNCIVGEKYVGGIVGYSSAQIEKCSSTNLSTKGYIKGSEYIGGIVGLNYLMGNIENSLNTAKIIVSKDNAGGIVGLNNASIATCYNNGTIDASECDGAKIGGICGQNVSESYINSSYNIGKINFKVSAEGVVGADFGTTSNCYYLDSSVNSKKEEYVKTESELKSVLLNELKDFYKEDLGNINNGYPVLSWEISEKN